MKRSRRRKLKKNAIIYLLIIFLIPCLIIIKPFSSNNNYNKVIEKQDTLYTDLDLDGYSSKYDINKEYQTVIKDNEIYLVNLNSREIVDKDILIEDKEHFELVINHLLHQKYNLSKADELALKTHIYMFKEHELVVYFEEYNSEDNLIVNYNEVKDFLSFSPSLNLNYEIEDNYKLDPNKITIALTFDDGPNGNRTLQLIDFLEKNECSATFFIQANRINNGKTAVLRVYNSHSELGYHSYAHAYFTKQDVETIKNEFKVSDNSLYEVTGSHFKLTRPPYGSFNDDTLGAIDTPFILWNLDTNDWKYRDANNAKEYVMKNYKDGAIILFHDSYNSSVEAIKMIIPLLKEKGVQITSVSRLAKLKGIDLQNNTVYRSIQ